MVSLWRKEYFLRLVFEDENPWEYEKNSNIRSRYAGYKIYTQNYDVSSPAFRYCMNPKDGYGITQGKWLLRNKEFFEQNGIYGIDYDNLGVFETETSYKKIQNESRQSCKERKIHQRAELKMQKISVRLKEYLYNCYKRLKKSFIFGKIKYMVTCVKYFFYYQKLK